jgi:hypothetical protein
MEDYVEKQGLHPKVANARFKEQWYSLSTQWIAAVGEFFASAGGFTPRPGPRTSFGGGGRRRPLRRHPPSRQLPPAHAPPARIPPSRQLPPAHAPPARIPPSRQLPPEAPRTKAVPEIEPGSKRQRPPRSEHAEQRRVAGRPVGPAFNDARRARQADVFVQPDDGRYVVRGPRGREHIFEPDGTHVTSIRRSQSAHEGIIQLGKRRPISSDEFERFAEIFK